MAALKTSSLAPSISARDFAISAIMVPSPHLDNHFFVILGE
jgi:hypothetical protein